MKTQHEATMQFSGYPLSIAEANPKTKKVELTVVKPSANAQNLSQKNSITDDPKNWDVEWFNSYE